MSGNLGGSIKWSSTWQVDQVVCRLRFPILVLLVCGLAVPLVAYNVDCFTENDGEVMYKATEECKNVGIKLNFEGAILWFDIDQSVDKSGSTKGTLDIGGCTSPFVMTVAPPTITCIFNKMQVERLPAAGNASAKGVTMGGHTNQCEVKMETSGKKSSPIVTISMDNLLPEFKLKFRATIYRDAVAAGFFNANNWVMWLVVVLVAVCLSSYVSSSAGSGIFNHYRKSGNQPPVVKKDEPEVAAPKLASKDGEETWADVKPLGKTFDQTIGEMPATQKPSVPKSSKGK